MDYWLWCLLVIVCVCVWCLFICLGVELRAGFCLVCLWCSVGWFVVVCVCVLIVIFVLFGFDWFVVVCWGLLWFLFCLMVCLVVLVWVLFGFWGLFVFVVVYVGVLIGCSDWLRFGLLLMVLPVCYCFSCVLFGGYWSWLWFLWFVGFDVTYLLFVCLFIMFTFFVFRFCVFVCWWLFGYCYYNSVADNRYL